MNSKQYLEQALKLAADIEAHLEELERLQEISTASGAISYDNDRVISSVPQTARFEDTVVRLVDLEKTIRNELAQLWQEHRDIRMVIGQVEDSDVRCVLRMRFLARLEIDVIAAKNHISRSTVLRRLDDGYKEVSKITGYPHPPKQRLPGRNRHHIARNMMKEVYSEQIH